MDWKTCTVCDHEFETGEERQLITCEHGTMLCPCGLYGYACLHHQQEADEANGTHQPIKMSVAYLPGGWEMETVHAGLTILRAALRQPAAMGSHEDEL